MNIALHIEANSLADGTYEIIQKPDKNFSETPANVVELIEAPNSNSEEPQSTNPIDTTPGKPRSIILLFQIMHLIVIIYLCI